MSLSAAALTGTTFAQGAAQGAAQETSLSPYVVGGAVLVFFVLLLAGLFAFGKGRQHT